MVLMLVLVLVLSLSSSSGLVKVTLAVVAEAAVEEYHVGGRSRGRDDCCLGGRDRAADLGELLEETLPGGNIRDEGDGVNPALEPEGEDGKCEKTGDGCKRSITGG